MANLIKAINLEFARQNLPLDAARIARIGGVNFFKKSFVKGGFTDDSFKQWQKSSSPLAVKDFPEPGVPKTIEARNGFTTFIQPLFHFFL